MMIMLNRFSMTKDTTSVKEMKKAGAAGDPPASTFMESNIMPSQPSPVAQRKRVDSARPKFEKLACTLKFSCSSTSPNTVMPATA